MESFVWNLQAEMSEEKEGSRPEDVAEEAMGDMSLEVHGGVSVDAIEGGVVAAAGALFGVFVGAEEDRLVDLSLAEHERYVSVSVVAITIDRVGTASLLK
ncbi:hypothetical protein GUJ93_ZPchr0008g13659 [Zizania palustris]|uniref:Uncharacterized protein n=1 Tax=Zizania palustris TaxID=103762 RepID=A0A8J5RYR7_ZIZPA|nr:hypothetical protein GUJ93_ZPchr0008g13659 [Zizania palustris]